MNDVRNIAALKMTEVYEWTLEKGLERQQQSAAGPSSSSASSLVTMLGIRKTEQLSSNPLAMLPLARPSSDSVFKSRTYLCSYKFRYAMVLCDFGLTSVALEYALDLKNFISFVNQRAEMDPKKGKPPTNLKTGGGSNECQTPSKPQPFSKGFVNTVNEFIDRLSGGVSKNDATARSGQGGTSSSGASSSSWNVWNMLNSANLKDLVDGPTERNPTPSQQPPPLQSSQKMTSSGPPSTASGPPSTASFVNNPHSNRSQNGNPLSPPPTISSYMKEPPIQSSNHGSAPPMSQYPSVPNNSMVMGPPGLKSSSSTGDLRDNFSSAPPIDNSLASMGHSFSNPGSHSGGAAPPSHPQHRKQHSADATPQPSKTSPNKPGPTKKGSESDKNIITSVRSLLSLSLSLMFVSFTG